MLEKYEKKVYSQNGEDGVIAEIFKRIGIEDYFFVEFGVEDGQECNTRLLKEQGWKGLQMDAVFESDFIHKHRVNTENINQLFKKYQVPKKFDLLSIDIDGNDYWVLKALKNYHPNVIVMEYNASIPVNEKKSIRYEKDFAWQGDQYFGASLGALTELLESRNYRLVYCDQKGVNAFFVKKNLLPLLDPFKKLNKDITEIYKPPNYGAENKGHPQTSKQFIIPTPPNLKAALKRFFQK